METTPKCPTDYILRKTKCKCVKIKTKIKTKKKSSSRTITVKKTQKKTKKSNCPSGKVRNPKTGRCNKKKLSKQKKKLSPKKILSQLPTLVPSSKGFPKTKKRCPKGFWHNKETGNCEPNSMKTLKIQKTKKKQSKITIHKDLITIPNSTPIWPSLDKISEEIKNITKESEKKKINPTKKIENLHKSFSPEINRALTQMKSDSETKYMDCGFTPKNPKVNIGTIAKPNCVAYTTKKAQKKMLNLLDTKKTLDCEHILSPAQVKANCWFNTFFMTYFISDKGRKFFRYFRRLMIKGEKANGQNIKPPVLHKSFFLLNMAIQSALDAQKGLYDITLLQNTNVIIKKITAAIKKGTKEQHLNIKTLPKEGEWGNPQSYYKRIMTYLDDNSLKQNYYSTDVAPRLFDKSFSEKLLMRDKPEMFTVSIDDSEKIQNKALSFNINTKSFKAKYQLDSIIIRNISKSHFCSVITCNGKDFGFDGGSYNGIERFDWKKLINKDKDWTFEGSGTKWNFCKGYMLLFYYRIE